MKRAHAETRAADISGHDASAVATREGDEAKAAEPKDGEEFFTNEELAKMSRSERKRHREKKRRNDVNKGFDDLMNLLLEIDPVVRAEAEDRAKRGQWKGNIGAQEENLLSRVDLITRAIEVLRRVHKENEDRKLIIEQLLRNAKNEQPTPSAETSLNLHLQRRSANPGPSAASAAAASQSFHAAGAHLGYQNIGLQPQDLPMFALPPQPTVDHNALIQAALLSNRGSAGLGTEGGAPMHLLSARSLLQQQLLDSSAMSQSAAASAAHSIAGVPVMPPGHGVSSASAQNDLIDQLLRRSRGAASEQPGSFPY
mmetsp:Transcript_32451/g.67673  ORF Transcript_32451/g.67673 Transcript_32451/m.67673 type:complete len:312 (-) Transcript_32451:231-1166(-)|eukprot:CAMPEP_0172459436 /NCGR_PEP_ID=MMETSP1065-20121228/32590_1 /TAXON_ID=265537 /ORGANISM="Amphiprora paludosa, Strain CCMP125" /LENGTH=311 /DNA_ID=CAMNT_0013214115 /DNA_START=120 /DNA_END=1055 /DNA_ORIENTATION=-